MVFTSLLKTSDAGGYERIYESDTLCCIDTPVRRISVLICMDYFHQDQREILRHTGINLFLVPAMSHKKSKFIYTAPILDETNLTSSFIAAKGWQYGTKRRGILHLLIPSASVLTGDS